MGREKYSLAKRIKSGVKEAVKFVSDFENTAAEIAISNGFDYVVCGHIHQAQMRTVETKQGKCLYLNAGDWVESLFALEYHQGSWSLFQYPDSFQKFESAELQSSIEEDKGDELLEVEIEQLIRMVTSYSTD